MDLFCTDVEWLALKRTDRRRTAAFLIPALLTPVLFVTLCLLIRTGNARVMHAVLLAVTGALGGTAVEASDRSGAKPRKASRIRSFFRGVSLVTLPLILWLFFTVIFGSFVFYRITDTDPSRKIMIFADGVTAGEDQLAARLEEQMGDPIRMVRIHPFSYMMFGDEELKTADLYILPDSHMAQNRDWLVPGNEGILMFDPASGAAVAGNVFLYTESGDVPEPYRLYIGANSPHLEDGMAELAAAQLIRMGTEEEGKNE